MKRLLIFFLAVIMAIGICACDNSTSPDVGDGSYDPSKNEEYYVQDISRENMIFDTEKLFNEQTSYETVELSALPQNMTALKFQSEAFPLYDIEYTLPFAVLGKPKTEMPKGGYPAIVLVHGGAGQVYPDWVKYWTDKGYVAIALDMFGNELNDDLAKVANFDGGPNEGQSGSVNDDPLP